MKYIVIASLAFALMALVALGQSSIGVVIEWRTLYAGYTHEATDLTGYDDYILDSYSVVWQLIYAGANNQPDPINLSNVDGGWVSGDDVVWATRVVPQSIGGANVIASDGTIWNNYLGLLDGDVLYRDTSWTTEGYFYQRVFQGTPQEGSWYFQTERQELVINPTPWQSQYLDSGTQGFQPNQQIPEPATMGLLGLGALALAFRRRRA